MRIENSLEELLVDLDILSRIKLDFNGLASDAGSDNCL
jgi:hypothetical protein